RVVVVDGAQIEPPVAPRFFPPAVEVHLEVAGRKAGAFVDVGVPIARVKAARMAVVHAALQGGLAKRLVDAAEPVAAEKAEVPGKGVRRGGLSLVLFFLRGSQPRGGKRGGKGEC